jgi:hypothetical protein
MSAESIYKQLKQAIGNDFGVFGLMGNLKAESNLQANNLQNTYSKKFGMTDAEYTKAVDDGSYTNFVRDSAGYGLAQWTYWSRKQNLLKYKEAYGSSIGDETMQVAFMIGELMASYPTVWNVLKNAKSVREASDVVLTQYERPADQSESVKVKRAAFGEEFMKQLVGTTTTEGKEETKVGFTNSPLVGYTNISPKKTKNRKYDITRITPHCIVGLWTAKKGCDYFATTDRDCSANYVVGSDGVIGLSVDEKDRSWCSSNADNDNRAITIECASDASHPYAFPTITYNKLIDLCEDICRRYGKTKLLWFGDKNKSLNYKPAANEMVLTVHRWFANKSCPGDWMYQRMGDLAAKVTAKLGGATTTELEKTPDATNNFPAVPFTVNVKIDDLNYRSQPSMDGVVKGQTGKGVFTIVEVNNGWGKLKSGAGWIWLGNSQYCTINDTVKTSISTFSPYKVRVSIKDLNIRKGPGTNYASNGFCPVGVYTIIKESDGAGASKWGKLKSGAGWISLDYVTKI